MNSNRRVLIFTLSSITIYLIASIVAAIFGFSWAPFNKVNLVADIIKTNATNDSSGIAGIDTSQNAPIILTDNTRRRNFNLYTRPNFITSFAADTTKPALVSFLQKIK
ncbi:MAG: hypothetical protein WDM90_24220 [Ferruginibacter sp.]